MMNKIDLPRAELQLALGNTNTEVTTSLLNEFPRQLLVTEQNVTNNTINLLSLYIQSMEYAVSRYTRQIEQVMLTNLWHVTAHIFCTDNWRYFVTIYWPTWRWHGRLSRSFSNNLATVIITCITFVNMITWVYVMITSFPLWWNYMNAAIPQVRHWAQLLWGICALVILKNTLVWWKGK